jgi:hypothetical protein
MEELKREAALLDVDGASPVERAVLMCIERIDALEERNRCLEEQAKIGERRERTLLDRVTMVVAGRAEVYFNIFAYLLGVPPDRPDEMPMPNIFDEKECLSFFERRRGREDERLARALELHGAVFPGLRPVWEGCCDTCLALKRVPSEHSVARLIELLTLEELEGFWEWRLKFVCWRVV